MKSGYTICLPMSLNGLNMELSDKDVTVLQLHHSEEKSSYLEAQIGTICSINIQTIKRKKSIFYLTIKISKCLELMFSIRANRMILSMSQFAIETSMWLK